MHLYRMWCAAQVEKLCGISGSKLRLTLMNQTRAYVEHVHEANKSQLVSYNIMLLNANAVWLRVYNIRVVTPSVDGLI
jgi:hypothetical protein